MKCVNIHTGKKYIMVDCAKEKNPPHNVVFPSQFARLLIEYQEHPEAKSLAPDGGPCETDTSGLLQRAHVIAGEFRYVGKETDHKWEEGDDISVLEFKTTEYGRSKMVFASEEVKSDIEKIVVDAYHHCRRPWVRSRCPSGKWRAENLSQRSILLVDCKS